MNAFRRSRLSAAVTAALLLAALPLSAQSQETDTKDAKTLDRVEVTGSRIKKAELEGLSPVQVISRADLERSGLSSIGDVLQQITASGSGLNTKFNSSGNFGFPPDGGGVGAGSTTVDLRHLGAKRVLVLVDGLRWVSESSASGVSTATDLNTIPMAMVDHIEVLEDGASSLYGSDAIAGVVNIITKKDFDGAQINVGYGAFDGKDGDTTNYDLTWGGRTEKARFMMAASYSKTKAIGSDSTLQSRFPVPGTGLTFGSSATPNGRFIFLDPRCPLTDLDDDGVPETNFCNITTPNGQSFPNGPVFTDGGVTDDFIGFGTANRFNFSEFNLLLTPSERKSVFTSADYDISERVRWKTKFLYNNRRSTNQAAPEPIFLGPDAGTGNPLADNITISASNPFNPFGVDLGPDNLILVGRRPIEGGPRIFKQDVDTWYFSTGLEGDFDFADRTFYWDVNAVRSENKADQTTFGSYNLAHINQALGPIANCTGSCVPLNIFGGPGTLTPDMLRYIGANLTDKSQNNLTLWSANLSGDLFELPAGAVSFAAGYEYRKNSGSFQPDALIVAGESNGVPALPTSGTITVNEVYGELNIPLLADVAFAKRLDVTVASRYSDYNTSGGTTNNKVGLRWQVSDEFLIRGTFAEGLRAASVGELFGSASRFDAVIADPCLIGLDGLPPEARLAANCAALGVPAGASQANSQISITTGGNPELRPESSDSYSAGFVWSPGFATNTWWSERVDYEVSWYRHELSGAIQAVDAQTQLDLCVETLDPQFCGGITRASTGGINGFANRLVNLGQITTEGYDFKFNWLLPDTSFGQFAVNWSTTYVDSYKAVGANGAVQPRGVGVEVNDSAIPEWTSNLVTSWHKGAFDASWTMRYISDLTEDCGDAASFDVCSDPGVVVGVDPDTGANIIGDRNHLGAVVYHDFQASWNADYLGGVKVSVGVNNVFDKQAPNCLSCSLNGFDASTYDLAGQYVYGRLQLNF